MIADVAQGGGERGERTAQRVAVVQRRLPARPRPPAGASATATAPPPPTQCHTNAGREDDAGSAPPARPPTPKHAIGGGGVATDDAGGDAAGGVARSPAGSMIGGRADGSPAGLCWRHTPRKSLRDTTGRIFWLTSDPGWTLSRWGTFVIKWPSGDNAIRVTGDGRRARLPESVFPHAMRSDDLHLLAARGGCSASTPPVDWAAAPPPARRLTVDTGGAPLADMEKWTLTTGAPAGGRQTPPPTFVGRRQGRRQPSEMAVVGCGGGPSHHRQPHMRTPPRTKDPRFSHAWTCRRAAG